MMNGGVVSEASIDIGFWNTIQPLQVASAS